MSFTRHVYLELSDVTLPLCTIGYLSDGSFFLESFNKIHKRKFGIAKYVRNYNSSQFIHNDNIQHSITSLNPKISHKVSGKTQISKKDKTKSIISGYYKTTKRSKGISIESRKLDKETDSFSGPLMSFQLTNIENIDYEAEPKDDDIIHTKKDFSLDQLNNLNYQIVIWLDHFCPFNNQEFQYRKYSNKNEKFPKKYISIYPGPKQKIKGALGIAFQFIKKDKSLDQFDFILSGAPGNAINGKWECLTIFNPPLKKNGVVLDFNESEKIICLIDNNVFDNLKKFNLS